MDGLTPQILAYLLGGAVLGAVAGWLIRAAQNRGVTSSAKRQPEFGEANHQGDQTDVQITSLQASVTTQQTIVRKLESSLAKSRDEYQSACERADLLARNVLTLREERENTKLQLTTIQNAFVAVKKQTLALQREFVKVGDFYKGELRKSFEKRKAIEAQLEAQVETAQSARKSATNLLNASRSEHNSINEMLDSAQVQLLQLGVLERNNDRLETENEQLNEDNTRMRQELEALAREPDEISALKIHNKELTRCLESMETSRRQHEDNADHYRESAGEHEKESDTLRLKLDDLQKSFAEMEAEQESALSDVRTSPAPKNSNGYSEPESTAPLPEGADDLKKILGIGKVFESTLHELGIFSYQQIANFGLSDISRVNSELKEFKGRMEQDDWIGQAKDLHFRKYGAAA